MAGGGPSGTLYVWNTSSGRLLTAHKAHMRGVTCMAFDDGGALLFTGGQDCILCCWWLSELVDSSKAAAAEPHWTRYRSPTTSVYLNVSGEGGSLCVGDDLGMLTGRRMVRDPDQSMSLEASKSLIT